MKIIASSDHLLEEKEHLAMDLGRNGYPDTFTRASSTSRRHTARDMREYPTLMVLPYVAGVSEDI